MPSALGLPWELLLLYFSNGHYVTKGVFIRSFWCLFTYNHSLQGLSIKVVLILQVLPTIFITQLSRQFTINIVYTWIYKMKVYICFKLKFQSLSLWLTSNYRSLYSFFYLTRNMKDENICVINILEKFRLGFDILLWHYASFPIEMPVKHLDFLLSPSKSVPLSKTEKKRLTVDCWLWGCFQFFEKKNSQRIWTILLMIYLSPNKLINNDIYKVKS